MLFGIDRLLDDGATRLARQRVGVIAHPASLTADGVHVVDALVAAGVDVRAAFGPQHGMRGDKQDNMIETADFADPRHGMPVYSLYGDVRRPTAAMLEGLDTLVFDLQDVGCRIYTYITTLRYLLEAAAAAKLRVVVLDRPNPAGRPVEGLALEPGHESFVGAAPMPTRHGLTVGELALWFTAELELTVDLEVVPMSGWVPAAGPGFGWPVGERAWVNPSPNAPGLNMVRSFPGTVMLEGTTLSEGRGTTTPLSVLGAADLDGDELLACMRSLAPAWLHGVYIRPTWFEPTFHKHAGSLCGGLAMHTDVHTYDHAGYRPCRLIALAFKAVRTLFPGYDLWRHHDYEYELERIPIDVICGTMALRNWVDDPVSVPADLDTLMQRDEDAWEAARQPFLLY